MQRAKLSSFCSRFSPPVRKNQTRATSQGKGKMEIVHPRARKILDFWWGDEWEKANFYDMRSEMMGLWFGGGEEVDKVREKRKKNNETVTLDGSFPPYGQFSCFAQ